MNVKINTIIHKDNETHINPTISLQTVCIEMKNSTDRREPKI